MSPKKGVEIEICCFSVQSAIEASQLNADRIELCGGFLEGGTTPSLGLVKEVLAISESKVYVMLRPRGGDFVYTESEIKVIHSDIVALKELKPEGFVFGALLPNGKIDLDLCKKVVDWCSPYPLTFHRAFDVSHDLIKNLEVVKKLGFERILTSGGKNSAVDALEMLQKLTELAGDQIQIMAGAGVNSTNVEDFIKIGISAIHCTAKKWVESEMTFKNEEINMGASSLPDSLGRYETNKEELQLLTQKLNKK